MMNLNNKQKNRGMTLVELMVVLAIFAIISAMVMFNYSDYKSSTIIKVISDDIALSIRQAQSYAIGVKVTSINGQASFPGYGVHFSTDSTTNSGASGSNGLCSSGGVNPDGTVSLQDPSCSFNDPCSLLNIDGTPVDPSCPGGGGGNPNPITTYQCDDMMDNDGDGMADVDDPSCHTDFNPANFASYNSNINDESLAAQCADGKDNDGDRFFDMSDPSCHTDFDNSNPGSYVSTINDESLSAECSDWIDNDNDGQSDSDDPQCHTNSNPSDMSSYNPNWNNENNPVNFSSLACSNGIDDDFDGLTDYDDPDCHADLNNQNIHSYDPNINDEGVSTIKGGSGSGGGPILGPSGPVSYFFKKIGEKIAQNTINPINRFLFKTIPQVFADSSVFNISGDNKSFILFADIPCNLGSGQKGNLQYDYSSSRQATPCGRLISPTEVPVCDPALVSNGVECLSVTNLVGPDKIAGFCLNQECENFINGTSANLRPGSLDFVFTRPNPDAAFCYTAPNAVNCTESVGVSHAGVVVQSTVDSRTKTIVVWSTGQISVY